MRKTLVGLALATVTIAGGAGSHASAQRISSAPEDGRAAISVSTPMATAAASSCGMIRAANGVVYWNNCSGRIQSIVVTTFGNWGFRNTEICTGRGLRMITNTPGLNRQPVLYVRHSGYCR